MKNYPESLAYFNQTMPESCQTIKLLVHLDQNLTLSYINDILEKACVTKDPFGRALKEYILQNSYYLFQQSSSFTNFFREVFYDLLLARRKLNAAVMALEFLFLPQADRVQIKNWLQEVSDLLRLLHFERIYTHQICVHALRCKGNFEKFLKLEAGVFDSCHYTNIDTIREYYQQNFASLCNNYLREIWCNEYEMNKELTTSH